jgi:hypothetical protein
MHTIAKIANCFEVKRGELLGATLIYEQISKTKIARIYDGVGKFTIVRKMPRAKD